MATDIILNEREIEFKDADKVKLRNDTGDVVIQLHDHGVIQLGVDRPTSSAGLIVEGAQRNKTTVRGGSITVQDGRDRSRTLISGDFVFTKRVSTDEVKSKSAEVNKLAVGQRSSESQVNGRVEIFNNRLNAAPTIVLDGQTGRIAAAGGVVQTSDVRLKTNISPLAYGVDTIAQLEPVNFSWRDSDANQIGLLAQQVQAVIPEAVSVADDDTHMIDFSALVPVLIQAVKTQQQQIDQLQTLVDQLAVV